MINKITPNFLPCGIPPFGDFHSEMVFPIRNAYPISQKRFHRVQYFRCDSSSIFIRDSTTVAIFWLFSQTKVIYMLDSF